ncbi:MAG: 2,4-dihydroxyhept-2-ene-1,7-dioic acid aldolase [Candidatus Adiutrix sp.]|jgi:2-dehydro-3-deoxyglucarate aldolase|nr:2,4-dihydroxyhept-2-ene-1,7-dioic acid aldolase [Candidatus Adiutrix sp.]
MISSGEIRKKMKAGQASLGTWLQIPNPDVAEIIGRLGYDWAAADLEHGAFTRADLPNIFRALELGGTLPFARLLEVSRSQIKGALESGARGLILPMIESREQLDYAIAEALYPGGREFASGRRGVGFCRANLYGQELDRHTRPGPGPSRDIVIVAQIEHARAIENLEAIFAHPRLDAYMVGPYDLSASMGLTGDFTHPDFQAAMAAMAASAEKWRIPKGTHVVRPRPSELQARLEEGYAFIAYGLDAVFLTEAARNPLKPVGTRGRLRRNLIDSRNRLPGSK